MANSETQAIGVKKKRWIVCFENSILNLDLTIYEKMVFIVLCSHAKKDGPAFPSVKTIAKEASCSRTKVFEALNALEERGIITRENRIFEKRGQTSNLYEIGDIEVESAPRPHGGQGDDIPPSPSAIRTGVSATRTGGVRDTDAPFNVLEQDLLNRSNEHTPPTPPRGEDEGIEILEPEKPEEQKQKTMTQPREYKTPQEPKSFDGGILDAILSAYNEILPDLPCAEKITNARAKELNCRIREDPERKELNWWRRYFLRVREFPWLMGHNPSSWKATFDWLIDENGMQKVVEGGFMKASGTEYSPEELREWQKRYTNERGIVDAKALLRDWRARTAGTTMRR
jgi:predicted transcriptional regulator